MLEGDDNDGNGNNMHFVTGSSGDAHDIAQDATAMASGNNENVPMNFPNANNDAESNENEPLTRYKKQLGDR